MVQFYVSGRRPTESRSDQRECVLVPRDWNDYWKFETSFYVYVVAPTGLVVSPGLTKIAQTGMGLGGAKPTGGYASPDLPSSFTELEPGFFSIGQSENYYETLHDLGELGTEILHGLRDCALDTDHFERHRDEYVMSESLLRSVTPWQVLDKFHNIALGQARLSSFEFHCDVVPFNELSSAPRLDYAVNPGSHPPTNIHALIGRNGVGKTHYLRDLLRGIVTGKSAPDVFSGVVSLSWSPFDRLNPDIPDDDQVVPFRVVSLESYDHETEMYQTKSKPDLAQEFTASLKTLRDTAAETRWAQALETLSSDILIEQSQIREKGLSRDSDWQSLVESSFKNLSSGHAAVLLSITRLVELVQERTLVLLDEPEGHLHPPLLSNFIRALSSLMLNRNGVAIIATHSPVVLQEIPRSCSWIIRRSGVEIEADRPSIETFGENVGVLTSEVFQLEVTATGYHTLLRDDLAELGTFDAVINKYDGQLGAEARAILRALEIQYDG